MDLAHQYPAMFRRVAERAWSDEAYRELLLSDPLRAVAQEGVAVPEAVRACGVTFKVVEDSDPLRHIILPARPCDELSDLELAVVAGGKGGGGKNGADGAIL